MRAPPTSALYVPVTALSITSIGSSEPFVAANDDVVAPIVNDIDATALQESIHLNHMDLLLTSNGLVPL